MSQASAPALYRLKTMSTDTRLVETAADSVAYGSSQEDSIDTFRRQLASSGEVFNSVEEFVEGIGSPDSAKEISQWLRPHAESEKVLEDRILGQRYDSSEYFKNHRQNKFMVEELVFGDRLHQAESKDYAMLTLLNVLLSQNSSNPFEQNLQGRKDKFPGNVDDFVFIKPKRILLRHILFNSPFTDEIALMSGTDNSRQWQVWRRHFETSNQWDSSKSTDQHVSDDDEENRGKTGKSSKKNVSSTSRGFDSSVLKQIETVFQDITTFASAVRMLRAWTLDNSAERQWCYKFTFPYGPEGIFWEMTKEHSLKANFMRGSGLVAFNMLARSWRNAMTDSKTTANLGAEFYDYFFTRADEINEVSRIICKILPDDVAESQNIADMQNCHPEAIKNAGSAITTTGYLPYRHLDVYDHLSRACANIMQLNLNKQERLSALNNIIFLAIICYMLEQQQKMLRLNGCRCNIDMIVCMDNLITQDLKNASRKSFKDNNDLFDESIKAFISARTRNMTAMAAPFLLDRENWRDKGGERVLSAQEQLLLISIMRHAFSIKSDFMIDLRKNPNGDHEPGVFTIAGSKEDEVTYSSVVDHFTSLALARDKHMDRLHFTYAREIGLLKLSPRSGHQYQISDDLLRTLIFAVMGNRSNMMLDHLLERIYEDWHLVIGPAEYSRSVGSDCSSGESGHTRLKSQVLELNVRALKERLNRLDMIVSLSDGCDYVRNPFSNDLQQQ